MKKKRDSNRQNWLLAVSFIVIILVALFGLIIFQLSYSLESLDEPVSTYDNESLITPITGCLEWWGSSENLAAIEQGAAITLPDSVSNLTASSVAFMDCSINVRFSMDAIDLDTFMASTYVEDLSPIQGSTLFTLINPNYDMDWNFDSETIYLYGNGGNSDREYQYIIVDTSDETTYIVYIITLLL
jgi:hypothetical protein